MNTVQEIAGYTVHPAAAVFPLIEGDDFDDLCESIRHHGVQHPAVVRGTELLDGRNRMRACERLKAEGWAGSCPTVEWKDDCRNVAEWIWDTNAIRRHMDDDGIAMASSVIWPLIAKENEARKAASKFDSETARKAAKARHAAGTKTSPPQKRDEKAKAARSTVGQVAKKAGTSMHKARQAVNVLKAIERGELPADTAKDVMAGKKKLRDVAAEASPKVPDSKGHAPSNAALNGNTWQRVFKALRVVRDGCEKLTKNRSVRRKYAAKELRLMADTIERDGKCQEQQANSEREEEPDRMLEEISYYALAFLDACPDRVNELEGLLLTWVSRCKQR